MRLLSALVVLAALACRGPHRPAAPPPPPVDAPYELADELDFAERADALIALPVGAARTALRRELAAVVVERLDRAIGNRRLDRAAALVLGLADLYRGDPGGLAELGDVPELATRLERARAGFARGGADREAALVLVVRAAVDPTHAADDREELDQILAFTDAAIVARVGELGRGGGPIATLAPIISRGLAPELVDRYVGLVIERANRADAAVATGRGLDAANPALRAALDAGREVAVALAANRGADRIAGALAGLRGFGRDRALDRAAAAVAAPTADPAAWAALAQAVRADDDQTDRETGLRAALAIALDGLVRFPDDPTLATAAALAAIELDEVARPTALLRAVLTRVPDDREVADRLLALYRERLGRLVFAGRLAAAADCLAGGRTLIAELRKAQPGDDWDVRWAQLLAVYGRGLVSQGELAPGRAALTESVRVAPTIEALEMLGTIALKTGQAGQARTWFERAIGLPGDRPAELYARAKLLRLAGDAADAAGATAAARDHYVAALGLWADLGRRVELPPNLAGERLVESGKLFWALDKPDDGVELITTASEADPDGADTHIQSVAFLLLHDRFGDARDLFYQALASNRIGDYYKVYMALWILAASRRLGDTDPQAQAYLAERDGPLWYDEIARLASGRRTPAELSERARTRPRQTELAYYTAVLTGPTDQARRALLEDVVASNLVLFFEYDMARHQLGRP